MPHPRPRLIEKLLHKRLKLSPIVAIQGARQTGKSFLALKLLKKSLHQTTSVTLDLLSDQNMAQSAPQTFLQRFAQAKPLIIDEVQKAPQLFDAIKYVVDQDRIPGQFLLLGSTEFSYMQNIRESLTGRMSRIRLFPMVARELIDPSHKEKEFSRNFLLKYCESGGMPGIAFVRDQGARSDLFQDWVDLTCTRDIHQFKRSKFESDLAFSILRQCCLEVEATQANLARSLKTDGRKIASHLKALCELFVLTKLDPHPSGKGKSIYLPLDAGIAHFLGANLEKKLHIILVNERMAQNSYFGLKRNRYFYYRSTGKNIIHLIEEDLDKGFSAFEIYSEERIKLPKLELLSAFKKKNPKTKCTLLAPIPKTWKAGVVNVQPWESILTFP